MASMPPVNDGGANPDRQTGTVKPAAQAKRVVSRWHLLWWRIVTAWRQVFG